MPVVARLEGVLTLDSTRTGERLATAGGFLATLPVWTIRIEGALGQAASSLEWLAIKRVGAFDVGGACLVGTRRRGYAGVEAGAKWNAK